MSNFIDRILYSLGIKKPKTIIVLGMHRSGTSCLTGLLEEAGVYLGSVSKKNPFNLKGNHENENVVNLNDDILKNSNGNWHSPPEKILWNEEHIKNRTIILENFKNINHNNWGFKDPRVLLTLDFWLEGINSPIFIGTFRHPLSVAMSIHSRDEKMSIEYGLEIWLKYNTRLLKLYNNKKFPLISFDVNSEQYIETVQNSLLKMGLSTDKNKNMEFFDDSLRNNKEIDNSYKLPAEVADLYQNLQFLYKQQNNF